MAYDGSTIPILHTNQYKYPMPREEVDSPELIAQILVQTERRYFRNCLQVEKSSIRLRAVSKVENGLEKNEPKYGNLANRQRYSVSCIICEPGSKAATAASRSSLVALMPVVKAT